MKKKMNHRLNLYSMTKKKKLKKISIFDVDDKFFVFVRSFFPKKYRNWKDKEHKFKPKIIKFI